MLQHYLPLLCRLLTQNLWYYTCLHYFLFRFFLLVFPFCSHSIQPRLLTSFNAEFRISFILALIHWLPVPSSICFNILMITLEWLGIAPDYISDLNHCWGPESSLRSSNKGPLVIANTKARGHQVFESVLHDCGTNCRKNIHTLQHTLMGYFHGAAFLFFCLFIADKNPCHLPEAPGPCRALLRRYYFDTKSHHCKQFYYGGCHGNPNNFRTLGQCHARCPNRGRSDWKCPLKYLTEHLKL